MKAALLIICFAVSCLSCQSQINQKVTDDMAAVAEKFLQILSPAQKAKAQLKFNEEERYNWHYVPKIRKGISLNDMNAAQRNAAMNLLRTALSDKGFQKTTDIIKLEAVLREVENRPANDDYRDPGKYYFTIFGDPSTNKVWGWRLEGHHVAFNFTSNGNRLVSGTPSFLGANPAIILSGPEKGKQILKDETELGFALLHSLSEKQKLIAIISDRAPADIITGASRKAIIHDSRGVLFNELNSRQQEIFLQLLSVYIQRYTRLFAMDMMREIETAGLNNLRFAWAGSQKSGAGNPHYYRIQGPTIIIEYDNTSNYANHVHTVIRDLKNDFGSDELLEHYKKKH